MFQVPTWLRGPPPVGASASIASSEVLSELAGVSPDEALQRLHSAVNGLAIDEVAQRLRTTGPNQVAHEVRHTIFGELARRTINPLNLLLLSLATASCFLGDLRAAIVISVMVALSVSLGFLQEHRSNKAAEGLRRMVRTTTTVRRRTTGNETIQADIPMEQIVPGDVVLLSAGDIIPADLRLISARDLFVNQSALTGEAMPIEKVAHANTSAAETHFDLPNICFMGRRFLRRQRGAIQRPMSSNCCICSDQRYPAVLQQVPSCVSYAGDFSYCACVFCQGFRRSSLFMPIAATSPTDNPNPFC